MRPIKFRGKRTDNGKWAYGYYIPSQSDGPDDAPEKVGFIKQCGKDWIRVDPETVGQFTGLLDNSKDKKEVYENDIIKCLTNYPNSGCKPIVRIGKVIYKVAGSVGFVVHVEHQGNFSLNSYMWNIEVIGNIHENPELLEKSPQDIFVEQICDAIKEAAFEELATP